MHSAHGTHNTLLLSRLTAPLLSSDARSFPLCPQDLDIAVTKATNHDVIVPKQKHVVTLYNAVARKDSPKDVIRYVLQRLSDRAQGSSEWLVVLKSLMVVHRLLREAEGDSFRQVLTDALFGGRRGGSRRDEDDDRMRGSDRGFSSPPMEGLALFSLSGWKDDSTPEAWEQSAWVKAYAAYLEERLQLFNDTRCDPQTEPTTSPSATRNWTAPQLLVGLPKLQALLRRLVDTMPKVPRLHAVTAVAAIDCLREVRLLFRAVSEALLNLVDKFFDMKPHDATAALDMYRRSVRQVQDLNAALHSLRAHEQLAAEMTRVPFPFEPPPAEFQKVMEEYINTGGWNGQGGNQQASAVQAAARQVQPLAQTTPYGAPARQPSNGDSSPPVYQLEVNTHITTSGVPVPPPRKSSAVDDLFGGPVAPQQADPFGAMPPVAPAVATAADPFGSFAPVAPAAPAAAPRPALNLDALYASAPGPQMGMGMGAPQMQMGGYPGGMMMPQQQPGMMMAPQQPGMGGNPFNAFGGQPQAPAAPHLMGAAMGGPPPSAMYGGGNPAMMMPRPGMPPQPPASMYPTGAGAPGMMGGPPNMMPQQPQYPGAAAYGVRPPAPFGAPAAQDPFSAYVAAGPAGGFSTPAAVVPGVAAAAPAPDPFSGLAGFTSSAPQPPRPAAAASNPFA